MAVVKETHLMVGYEEVRCIKMINPVVSLNVVNERMHQVKLSNSGIPRSSRYGYGGPLA